MTLCKLGLYRTALFRFRILAFNFKLGFNLSNALNLHIDLTSS